MGKISTGETKICGLIWCLNYNVVDIELCQKEPEFLNIEIWLFLR